jgi:hypothetical protein
MKQVFFSRALMATAVLLFCVAACYGQKSPADQLVGTWTKPMGERSITFSLKADHSYEVEFAGDEGVDVFGKFEVSGTQITFNDEGGEYSADVPGVYTFQVEDKTLKLTAINDPVSGRSMLVQGSWAKAEDD